MSWYIRPIRKAIVITPTGSRATLVLFRGLGGLQWRAADCYPIVYLGHCGASIAEACDKLKQACTNQGYHLRASWLH